MAGPSDPAKPISLFYSYSHKDEELGSGSRPISRPCAAAA